MKRSLVCVVLLFSVSALRAEEGFWLNAPDLGHSIQVPFDWPFPGPSGSLTPPGMAHLFFLTSKSGSFVMDVAAQKEPGKDSMPAADYFDLARQMGGNPPIQKAPLKDKSQLRYCRSVEAKPGHKDYFIQGVLTKGARTYYITISSPKGYPSPKEWNEALKALASLRTGASTAGGLKKDLR